MSKQSRPRQLAIERGQILLPLAMPGPRQGRNICSPSTEPLEMAAFVVVCPACRQTEIERLDRPERQHLPGKAGPMWSVALANPEAPRIN